MIKALEGDFVAMGVRGSKQVMEQMQLEETEERGEGKKRKMKDKKLGKN